MLPAPPITDEKRRLMAPPRQVEPKKEKKVYTANEMWNRQRMGRSATDRMRPFSTNTYVI